MNYGFMAGVGSFSVAIPATQAPLGSTATVTQNGQTVTQTSSGGQSVSSVNGKTVTTTTPPPVPGPSNLQSFIAFEYQTALHRSASAADISSWASAYPQIGCTGILNGILFSAEAQNIQGSLGNNEFINYVCQTTGIIYAPNSDCAAQSSGTPNTSFWVLQATTPSGRTGWIQDGIDFNNPATIPQTQRSSGICINSGLNP